MVKVKSEFNKADQESKVKQKISSRRRETNATLINIIKTAWELHMNQIQIDSYTSPLGGT